MKGIFILHSEADPPVRSQEERGVVDTKKVEGKSYWQGASHLVIAHVGHHDHRIRCEPVVIYMLKGILGGTRARQHKTLKYYRAAEAYCRIMRQRLVLPRGTEGHAQQK